MVLSDLLPDILGRIEENVETGAPIFWSLTGEVYPQMVDGEFEAALITGVIQKGAVLATLAAETTYFGLQVSSQGYGEGGYGSGGYGGVGAAGIAGQGILAPIRMRAPYPIRKTTLHELDNMIPGWQQASPSPQIIAWFPLGISGFGIYPQLDADTGVTMDFLFSPVNQIRPYDGTQPIPFQTEFADLIAQYGAAGLRMKEGGAEAEEADTVYQAYLSRAKALSLFQNRIDSLVYTGSFGGRSQINARTQV